LVSVPAGKVRRTYDTGTKCTSIKFNRFDLQPLNVLFLLVDKARRKQQEYTGFSRQG